MKNAAHRAPHTAHRAPHTATEETAAAQDAKHGSLLAREGA